MTDKVNTQQLSLVIIVTAGNSSQLNSSDNYYPHMHLLPKHPHLVSTDFVVFYPSQHSQIHTSAYYPGSPGPRPGCAPCSMSLGALTAWLLLGHCLTPGHFGIRELLVCNFLLHSLIISCISV